ncbi:MAG: FHA domain-containing protein [Chloroflexi bacterium]|nr:FHA domain-containing protein [Chloroflexota bacterium]
MSRLMRLYYYGVFGAIGGLIGWQISNTIGLSFSSNVYLSDLVVGALIGVSVGALIGFAEGLPTRNFLNIARTSLITGSLGLVGGAFGLPLAEWSFQILGGDPWARALGWGIFGLLIGVAAGVTSGAQMWKGALGGLLGGILGGGLLEGAWQLLADPLLGKAIGLILLGASVGIFIALIVYMLSKAWFTVTNGKLKGTDIILDKFIKLDGPAVFIGSSALKADIVLPDPDISPQHALLIGAGTHFTLKDISLSGTFINKDRVEQVDLRDRQSIQMGNTEFVYHERR